MMINLLQLLGFESGCRKTLCIMAMCITYPGTWKGACILAVVAVHCIVHTCQQRLEGRVGGSVHILAVIFIAKE